jgi:putative tryptophan/tyrosine transport system substrate-binding protein
MNRRHFITLLGGAAAAWPLAGRAQQPVMPVVGFLSARSPEESAHLVEAFRRGLREGGFAENENVAIEFRWAKGDYGRLPALAADLVNRRVNVLAAVGGDPSALAAKRATSEIPIVFGVGGDPVQLGLVASLNRPGGNVTGLSLLTNLMEPKRLGLLRDLAPGVTLIGALINPNFPGAVLYLEQIENAARAAGQRIVIARASGDEELEAAFALLLREGVGALMVAGNALT